MDRNQESEIDLDAFRQLIFNRGVKAVAPSMRKRMVVGFFQQMEREKQET